MSSFLCPLVQEKREPFLKTPMTPKHFFSFSFRSFEPESHPLGKEPLWSDDDNGGLVEGGAAYDRVLFDER